MFNTLTDYNYHNNTPLSNENIREAIRKVIEEESMVDTNNFTADKFTHASNAQINNENAIFRSDKLD